MKIWTVMAQKGGVGKTTTLVNLAGALTAQGARVLAIDLDPHGSLTSYFDFGPECDEGSVHEVFSAAASDGVCDITRLPRRTVVDKLEMITSATALVSLERRCGLVKGMGRVLSRQLPKLAERYDYCLLDCPPTLGRLVINALAALQNNRTRPLRMAGEVA